MQQVRCTHSKLDIVNIAGKRVGEIGQFCRLQDEGGALRRFEGTELQEGSSPGPEIIIRKL